MSDTTRALQDIIELSRFLGDPQYDFAILGEGNTSVKIDSDSFFIKASGKQLGAADANSFVAVNTKRAISFINGPDIDDLGVKDALLKSKVDQISPVMPSVETFFHAYLQSLPDVNYVGHTHPTAVNSIMCSVHAEEAVSGRLFPDEIVCCGPEVVFIPYTDPGMVLSRILRERVEAFIDKWNMAPKCILMQNHGLIALGKEARDVKSATLMYVKTARVLIGTHAFGGPNYFTDANVARIHTRPDEHYRQNIIGK